MLSPRTDFILRRIIEQYIEQATPVPSQSLAREKALQVSSATIRNEMVRLEQEGYIFKPHTSAGSVPSDKGYRYYVASLKKVGLGSDEQRLIAHLFHQVEQDTEQWLRLAATLLAQMVKNVAVVTTPHQSDCKFKHVEIISLKDTLALAVLVLHGARIRQQLITLDQPVLQPTLSLISNKLNHVFAGLTGEQIATGTFEFSALEKQIAGHLVEMMRTEDDQPGEEPYLDGLHFMLKQPEFVQSDRLRPLMELVEQRKLLQVIMPRRMSKQGVYVSIGKENEEESIRDYSVVISRYGVPGEATGTVGIVGPTRMAYSHAIPTVEYLASVLSRLIASLYGKDASFTETSE
ncbi:MAG: heat-inducible transcriptional repressor HrcA [Dehalococcoidales bacterium]|nr:heat-inducible transcriptional repressor HrcA [Dehalococcoidales bacterium]